MLNPPHSPRGESFSQSLEPFGGFQGACFANRTGLGRVRGSFVRSIAGAGEAGGGEPDGARASDGCGGGCLAKNGLFDPEIAVRDFLQ